MAHAAHGPAREAPVRIPVRGAALDADLGTPTGTRGLVVFAHGSGSGRRSPRNRAVAAALWEGGFATLLLDLLTRAEEEADEVTRAHRFDIGLLARRLVVAVDWARRDPRTARLPIGLFGASTGAAAALVAATQRPDEVAAVVSRGGRPDLAGAFLARVAAPTLLVVGGSDDEVIALNRAALARLACTRELAIVPGATHLFEEPGALEAVARLARDWFARHLPPADAAGSRDAR